MFLLVHNGTPAAELLENRPKKLNKGFLCNRHAFHHLLQLQFMRICHETIMGICILGNKFSMGRFKGTSPVETVGFTVIHFFRLPYGFPVSICFDVLISLLCGHRSFWMTMLDSQTCPVWGAHVLVGGC
jgi:hypothetical protein